MKVTVTIGGYFTKRQAENIKERMQGFSYLNYQVEYSNCAGNYSLIVTSDYYEENEYDTKADYQQALEDDFLYHVLTELAEY